MTVLRITPNLESSDPGVLAAFYRRLLGVETVMDHGWIVTLAGSGRTPPQLSLAMEGGSGTAVPALSIEVDDLDAVYARALHEGVSIAYPLTREPWGVQRFFFRDPVGTLVNVLTHEADTSATSPGTSHHG